MLHVPIFTQNYAHQILRTMQHCKAFAEFWPGSFAFVNCISRSGMLGMEYMGLGSGISHPLHAHKIGKNLNINFNFYMYQIILSLDNEKQDILTFG